jgi:hypothetical protein
VTPPSFATALRCIECGAEFALDYRLECAACRGLLELTYDWEALHAFAETVFPVFGVRRP